MLNYIFFASLVAITIVLLLLNYRQDKRENVRLETVTRTVPDAPKGLLDLKPNLEVKKK